MKNIHEIKHLIAMADLEPAIDELFSYLNNNPLQDTETFNSLIIQKGRYSELKKNDLSGLISHEQSQLTRNQISNNLLKIVDQIEKWNHDTNEIIYVPKIGNVVIGREGDADNIFEKLTKHNFVIIRGQGGVGKTAFVHYFIQKFRDIYNNLLWIDTDPNQNIKEIILKNNYFKNLLPSFNSVDIGFNILQKKLSSKQDKSLLVIDSISYSSLIDYDKVIDFSFGSNWDIIYITRDNIDYGNYFNSIYLLEPVSMDSSFEIFYRLYKGYRDDISLEKIMLKIERNTLLICKIASVATNNYWSIEEALTNISTNGFKINDNALWQEKINLENENILQYILNIFSIEDIRKTPHFSVLKAIALLPSTYHTYQFLQDITPKEPSVILKQSINYLVAHGWVDRNERNMIKMDRLTNEVILSISNIKNENSYVAILKRIEREIFNNPHDDPFEKIRWIPYAEKIINTLPNKFNRVISIKNNLALLYRSLGRYKEAKNLLQKQVNGKIKVYDRLKMAVYSNYASILFYLNEKKEAMDLMNHVVEIAMRNEDKEVLNIPGYLSDLASFYVDDDASFSIKLFKEAIHKHSQLPNSVRIDLSTYYSNLASVYLSLKQVSNALECAEKAFMICKNELGESHPTTLTFMFNLIQIKKQNMNKDDSRILIKNGIKALEDAAFPVEHPLKAYFYHAYAGECLKLNNLTEAYEYEKMAYDILEYFFNPQHPFCTESLSNLMKIQKQLESTNKVDNA